MVQVTDPSRWGRAVGWQDAPVSVRIAPEWRTGPFWITRGSDPSIVDNATPRDVVAGFGVSAELAAEIDEWDAEFQRIWDPDDPASAEFPSAEAEARWEERGRLLARRLAAELGPQVRVSYYDDVIQPGTG